jgi:beta-glucosidase
MIEATYHFHRDFLWGTATSSHQVEGQNTNNDWWAWEQEAGRIALGQRAGKACDWWGGRWKEDLDRAVDAAQNAHRLSLEWSRIEPRPGKWDEDALAFYREMINGICARGLVPMVTLHHFTNPIWCVEQGGWENEQTIASFERYAAKVVEALSDKVWLWVTINEPNVFAYMGYLIGVFPPGKQSLSSVLRVLRNLAHAHAAAYQVIHRLQPHAQVGVAHHYRGMRPARSANPLDGAVCKARKRAFNDFFPHLLSRGRAGFLGYPVRIPQAAGTQDYFGLNYYTRESIHFDIRRPGELFGRPYFPEGADLSPTGWIANDAQGMWEALRWAHSFGLPIYVTENGVEDASDKMRPRYLAAHIRQVWRAANFNWRLRGYFHWSLVDNFEWERGWTQRFGLWELDPETQQRKKRGSADLYAEICKANGLPSTAVAQYAPEVLDDLFPASYPGEIAPQQA